MKRTPKKSLVIDISNILFRVASMQKQSPFARDATTEDLVGISMHISLFSIHKYYNKVKPDFVVFAFEGGNNWRKTFTTDNDSRQDYKGNRVVDPEMKHFYILMESFRETMTAHTSICCLCIDTMEADDGIAGYCQLYSRPDHEIVIISGDRDFTQLLKLPGVSLINPDNGKPRNTPGDKEYEPDLDYWLFKKCIRGDSGDNVPSAFPRVRETKIKKAYENDYDRLNFMNETWVEKKFIKVDNEEQLIEVTHRVGDLYEENIKLMDLSKQPGDLRLILEEGIKMQVEDFGKYSHFHFLRFLGKYNLNKVAEDASRFIDMFSCNQRFMSGTLIQEKQKEQQKEVNAQGLIEF